MAKTSSQWVVFVLSIEMLLVHTVKIEMENKSLLKTYCPKRPKNYLYSDTHVIVLKKEETQQRKKTDKILIKENIIHEYVCGIRILLPLDKKLF